LRDTDTDETLAEGRLNLYTVGHESPLGETPA
jgi:hypothetical protein